MNETALLSSALKLVNGDKKLCFRLIKHTRETNPKQPMKWCLEKVIWDLERDRC